MKEKISWNVVCKITAFCFGLNVLTHWVRVTHICVDGSDNGLSPVRRQAIIWTIAGILLIGPSRTSFSEILIRIQTLSFKKLHLKTSSAKWRLFCLGFNVLKPHWGTQAYGKHIYTELCKYTFRVCTIIRTQYLYAIHHLRYIG